MSRGIKLIPTEGAMAEAIMVFSLMDKDIVILWKLTCPNRMEYWGVVNRYTNKFCDCFSQEQALDIFNKCCEKYREEVGGGIYPS